MVSEVAGLTSPEAEHTDLRLRLSDIALNPLVKAPVPFADRFERVRKEWTFIARLSTLDERKDGGVTALIGTVAFLLGALSPEVLGGGRPDLVGMTTVSGAAYVQTLLSMAMWGWFVVRLWTSFPVMRVHVLTMFVCWGLMMGAQLLFHIENANFPLDVALSQLSTGSLLTIVAVFMLYMLGTAVRETRDMHVEEFHVHEDVRRMSAEMEEHSLYGWGALFVVWFALVTLNAWSGAHFVAERHAERWGVLTLHVITAPLIVGSMLVVAWFPQRMLGTGATVRTRAARFADADLLNSNESSNDAVRLDCPSCGLRSEDLRTSAEGSVEQRCLASGCKGWGPTGTSCTFCERPLPSRLTCVGCGINTPIAEFLSGSEVW